MNGTSDHPPDGQFLPFLEADRLIPGVLGMQFRDPAAPDQALDGQFVVHHGHHHRAVHRFEGTVHHDDVAIVDAGIDHGIALDPQEEGCGFVLDQQFVEIEHVFHVVVGGRREAGRHGMAEQGDVSGCPGSSRLPRMLVKCAV